jgi:two-component system, NtrC family, sensor kinase
MPNQNENTNPRLREIISALQTLSTSQVQETDINKIHLQYASMAKKLLDAEMVALLLVDLEDKRILIRKILIGEANWSIEDSFQIEYEQLSTQFPDGSITNIKKRNEMLDRFPFLDLMKDQPFKDYIYAPLIINTTLAGIIQSANCHPFPPDPIKIDLLKLICNSYSSAIANFHAIRQLRIDNANLEAWRWELLQSRNTLRAMFDSIPTSIYIIDNKYRIVAINASRADRANQKPNALVGQICYEVLYKKTAPCQGCRVNETFISGRNTTRTDRQWVDNDQISDWEITTFAIQDEIGNPLQVIILEQDVTIEKRLEANLIQSEKLAAVGQLAAGVAHEINNPLSAVIANAQLLRRDLPNTATDALESVQLIETAGVRASQVVRNLLGFARKEQFEFQLIDLNETILNALTLVKHELVIHHIEVVLELSENLPQINASRDHLQSVWINIILNALDSVKKGSGIITITSGFVNKEFRISISDNGVGIPADKVSRIFEPFFTTKAPGQGTGLGLSVCHRIVKQHGGYIQVDSLIGIGTKFTITLPGVDK